MNTPLNPEETPELIERLDQGDSTAISSWWARREEKLLALARKIRGRYSLDEAEYGDDDAVNDTLEVIYRFAREGALAPVATREAWWSKIAAIMKQKIRLASDRLRRKKRGGAGIARSGPRRPTDPAMTHGPRGPGIRLPSAIDDLEDRLPLVPQADRLVEREDLFQFALDRLVRSDLKAILILIRRGYTIVDLAEHFEVSRRTIQRKIKLIELVLIECGFL